MTIRQIVAAFLLGASWEIPFPQTNRYHAARRDLARCMRCEP